MSWRKQPPTVKEWRDAKNHGMWWVKFKLADGKEGVDEDGDAIYWPEVWYTDIVQIYATGWRGKNDGLVARGFVIKDINLDDTEATKNLYWQPTIRPIDDIDYEEPKV